MGNKGSVLKVYVDEKKKKVMFAEAQEDFVEVLFSFFTLPLGRIARLLRFYADSKDDTKVGSLLSLYESVVNLYPSHFSKESCKSLLLYPVNSSAGVCHKLKRDLNGMEFGRYNYGTMFLKKKAKFIITDDLKVVPADVLDTSIELFNSLGVDYIDSLQKRTMYFHIKEFVNLLKWSLLTNNPLTNMVLGGNKPIPSLFTNSTPFISNPGQTQTVKLLVQKSNKKVLCAQVENHFVELLFTFLTIPLGAYERLTNDGTSQLGISNLYKSILYLGDGNYLKSEDVKTMLLRPKLASNYFCATDLIPIYEVDTHPQGRFLEGKATFIVSDDLKVTTSPSIATDTILTFNTPGVPIGDMEILEMSVGEHEAVLLLKASLTSASALNDWLRVIRKIPKDHVPKFVFAGDGGRKSEEEADFTLVKKIIRTHYSQC